MSNCNPAKPVPHAAVQVITTALASPAIPTIPSTASRITILRRKISPIPPAKAARARQLLKCIAACRNMRALPFIGVAVKNTPRIEVDQAEQYYLILLLQIEHKQSVTIKTAATSFTIIHYF